MKTGYLVEPGCLELRDISTPRANNITKHEMIGPKDGAQNFEIRYFEVAPGSST